MNQTLVKLNHQVIKSGREYLEQNGYTEIMVPRVVRASGACENINTLFEVKVEEDDRWFCGKKGYLAQTGQLYLEAMVPKFKKVFCAGPSFRAEPKADNRHLTEFQMLEIELETDFNGLLREIAGVIHNIAKNAAENKEKIGLDNPTVERLNNCPKIFNEITYDEAIKLLIKLGFKKEWGNDISSLEEQKLVEYFGNQPLFITRFPDPMYDFKKDIEVEKFFNMIPDRESPGRVLSADLILPYGGESVGAAARIYDADTLQKRLKNSRMFKRLLEKGGDINDFAWYIEQLEKNSNVPHAGCGIGLARVSQWILGESDIRNCIVFPSNKEILI